MTVYDERQYGVQFRHGKWSSSIEGCGIMVFAQAGDLLPENYRTRQRESNELDLIIIRKVCE